MKPEMKRGGGVIIVGYHGPIPGGAKATTGVRVPSTSAADPTSQVFDGFPYIVARLGPLVFLVQPVPANLRREELIALARGQADASGLSNCLALGLRDGVYCEPGGEPLTRESIPCGGEQVSGRLLAGPRLPADAEVEAREVRLDDYLRERGRIAQESMERRSGQIGPPPDGSTRAIG